MEIIKYPKKIDLEKFKEDSKNNEAFYGLPNKVFTARNV